MTDFRVAALARKWCPNRDKHYIDQGPDNCQCPNLIAAIREALEAAEKIVLGHTPDVCDETSEDCTAQDCLTTVAAAIAALREGR